MDNLMNRRSFFKKTLGTVAAVSVAQLVANRVAFAEDLPHVDETSPQATGLGYHADATKTDTAKYKNYVAGSQCSGCQLFSGAAGAEFGPCALFPGKSVAGKGWCSAFVKKAG
jgi:hypothetical protein